MTEQQTRNPCGAATRWCRCGPKPPRGRKDFGGHHQHGHNVSPESGKRHGACGITDCPCRAFDAWPCDNTLTMANGRCRMHGGASLVGHAAPGFQARGFSQVLPAPLAALYEAALSDPKRLSLEQETALLKALLVDVAGKLEGGEHVASGVFTAAAAVFAAQRQFRAAHRSGNPDRLAEALTKLDEAVGGLHGALDPARVQMDARGELVKLSLAIARLKRDENDRLVDLHGMVSLELAIADRHRLVEAMLEVLDKHVHDPESRRAIRRDTSAVYARLTGRRDDPAPAAGRGRPAALDAEYSAAGD